MAFEKEASKISETVNAVSAVAVSVVALAQQFQELAIFLGPTVQALLLTFGGLGGLFSRPFTGILKKK